MSICDQLRAAGPHFSFEFFPPKNDEGVAQLFEALTDLRAYAPTYVSVTYGAGGSTRNVTVDLVARIQSELGLSAMAHLTCVGASRDEIRSVLDELWERGVRNVLALRGDPPHDQRHFVPHPDGFRYASELAEFVKGHRPFCVAGACYPERHPEAASLEADIAALERKVALGAEFLITQLFFDSRDYFRFVERVRKVGIDVPIVPGIMPITNVSQIKRFTETIGARIPAELLAQAEAHETDKAAVRAIGVEHATKQCIELLAGGAPGVHFYTLNRSLATREILDNLRARV